MATKKKRLAKKATNRGELAEIKGIELIVVPDLMTYYINHAEISMTQHDFGITVARLPAKLSPAQIEHAQAGGGVQIEPVLQLVFPPTLLTGLIDALTQQKAQYESMFGPILDVKGKKNAT